MMAQMSSANQQNWAESGEGAKRQEERRGQRTKASGCISMVKRRRVMREDEGEKKEKKCWKRATRHAVFKDFTLATFCIQSEAAAL